MLYVIPASAYRPTVSYAAVFVPAAVSCCLSPTDVDYFFGQMCGVLFASTFFMMTYAIVRRNRPIVYPRVIVPGILSGIMWGIAMGKGPIPVL